LEGARSAPSVEEGATPVMKEEADAYSFSMLCYEILTGLNSLLIP
jgi:hypothetical protein